MSKFRIKLGNSHIFNIMVSRLSYFGIMSMETEAVSILDPENWVQTYLGRFGQVEESNSNPIISP